MPHRHELAKPFKLRFNLFFLLLIICLIQFQTLKQIQVPIVKYHCQELYFLANFQTLKQIQMPIVKCQSGTVYFLANKKAYCMLVVVMLVQIKK
jgi:hypothetical protein